MVTCAAQTPKERRYLRGYLKRAAAVMMCCVLVFSFTFCSLSAPKAKAFVAESGFIGSFIGVVMSSMGYTWTANGMNEQGFGDALEDVIVEYLNTEVGGMTIEEWALVGTSVALSGNSTLLIQQGLMQKIMDFADWFTDKFGLDDNSPVDVSGGGNLFSASTTNSYGTLSYPTSLSIVSSGSFITFEIPLDVSGKYVCSKISDYDRYGSPFVFQVDILNANRQTVSPLNVSGLGRTYWSMDDDSHSLATVWNINDDVLALGACVLRMTVVSPSNPYYSKISVGEYSLQQVCSFSRVSDASLSVVKSPVAQNPDIADDGTQAYKVTVANLTADDLEGLINAAVSQAIAGTLVTEGTVTDAVPIVSEGTMVGDISLEGIQAVQEDLSAVFISKFPFCIPWDFAKAVSLLAAPPQTPHWEVDFFGTMNGQYGVNWQGDTKIVIDFAEFELLGIVCRWTSTLMFCFVLITSTKRLIWTA